MKKSIIIITAILVVVGLGGYVYMNNKDAEQSNVQNTESMPTSEEKPLSEEKPSPYDPSEGGKYLVIKEWGVRMKVDDAVRKVSYTNNGNGTFLITSKSASIKGCKNEPLLVISRGKENDIIAIGDATVKEMIKMGTAKDLQKVGEYYFAAAGPQAPCNTVDSQENDTTILRSIQGLGRMFETIEANPQGGSE